MTQTLAASARESDHQVNVTRWVATIAGLLGFVLSVLTPLLPVVQTTRRTVRRCTVVTRAGKCACGKTSDAAGNCDGSHAKKMCGMSRGRYYMLWRMHRCGWHLSRSSDSHLLRRLRQDCQPQGLLRRQPR